MSHTDPIADMLTRIKNAVRAEKKDVVVPYSGIKKEIANVLKREGYIADFKVEKAQFPPRIIVELKYKSPKENVISGIKRISKPGCRIFVGVDSIPKVLGGLGVAVISTSKGIFTGKECERNNIGGEVLLHVW